MSSIDLCVIGVLVRSRISGVNGTFQLHQLVCPAPQTSLARFQLAQALDFRVGNHAAMPEGRRIDSC